MMISDQDKLILLADLPLSRARAVRSGLRWIVVVRASDNIDRPISFTGCRFWRWITAARIAAAMNAEMTTAAWIALGTPTRTIVNTMPGVSIKDIEKWE